MRITNGRGQAGNWKRSLIDPSIKLVTGAPHLTAAMRSPGKRSDRRRALLVRRIGRQQLLDGAFAQRFSSP